MAKQEREILRKTRGKQRSERKSFARENLACDSKLTNNKLSSRCALHSEKIFHTMIFPLNYVKNICQSRFFVEDVNISAFLSRLSARLDRFEKCFVSFEVDN